MLSKATNSYMYQMDGWAGRYTNNRHIDIEIYNIYLAVFIYL